MHEIIARAAYDKILSFEVPQEEIEKSPTFYRADKYEEISQLWKAVLSDMTLISFEVHHWASYVIKFGD